MAGFVNNNNVPNQNSTDNLSISDVIGNKDDSSFSDSSLTPSVIGHLVAQYYHVHDSAKVYPVGAGPVTLTDKNDGGGTPWGHGAKTQVVPASTIATKFDIHYIVISGISAADDFELMVYKGGAASEVLIGTIAFSRDATFLAPSQSHPIQIPPQAADERISMSLASSGSDGKTCDVKVYYHQYPDIT